VAEVLAMAPERAATVLAQARAGTVVIRPRALGILCATQRWIDSMRRAVEAVTSRDGTPTLDALMAIAPDGYMLVWNCFCEPGGPFHRAHLHVIPRFHDEPLADQGGRSAIKAPVNRRPDPFAPGAGRARELDAHDEHHEPG
jgi:hypothetical protein